LSTAADVRKLPTPEGIPLRIALAGVGDRLAALAIDLFILNLVAGLVVLLMLLASGGRERGGLALAVMILVLFILRCFYFPIFELRWMGQTPGKRALRLRVMDSRGGPLRTGPVVARNLLRELELFQPLFILSAPQLVAQGFPAWVGLLAGGWVLAFAALPLLNRDRLRAGDLVAGTLVVQAPKLTLLDDLGLPQQSSVSFTEAQLDVYGAFELQTLEGVLRLERSRANEETLRVVASSIQKRIGWVSGQEEVDPLAFLSGFYAAQRARLEQRLLLGERRERKRVA
jgi:uncharacterized RDD family membrane protein YckC